MNTILIDTDVLLDLFFDRKPYSKNATKILNLCKEKVVCGFATPVIIANTHYILRKNVKH